MHIKNSVNFWCTVRDRHSLTSYIIHYFVDPFTTFLHPLRSTFPNLFLYLHSFPIHWPLMYAFLNPWSIFDIHLFNGRRSFTYLLSFYILTTVISTLYSMILDDVNYLSTFLHPPSIILDPIFDSSSTFHLHSSPRITWSAIKICSFMNLNLHFSTLNT